MERLHKFESTFTHFHTSPNANILYLYTPITGIIATHNLQTLTHIKTHYLTPFISLTSHNYTFLITTSTHISVIEAYSGQRHLHKFSSNCQSAHILSNNKLIYIYSNYLIVYNQYNQEESRYNYDRYKIINNTVLIQLNNLITQFNDDMIVIQEKYIDCLYDFFRFSAVSVNVFRGRIVYLCNNVMVGNNFVHRFDLLSEQILDFDITESFIFLKVKKGVVLYDRKENQNVNLQISAGLINKYVNQIQCGDGFIKCGMYEVFDEYLVCMRKHNILESFKVLGVCGEYIEGVKTYDYVDAECEFDISDEDED